MKQALGVSLLAAAIAVSAFAQPSISGLQNNYSYIVPGAPNYGIAQGSIFIIYGKNMGTASLGLQGVPLNKTYGGLNIQVTVNGTTTQAIPYYVTPTQSAAILPSATPVGTGTITVAIGGQTSATFPITVVQSAFGILTMNGAGSGMAAGFDVRYSYLGINNAANPGETITLWGTGIGPASGDETVLQTPTNLTAINAQVWIGGKSATVSYRGRSQYPGLDQINAVVPSGVSGCAVSVVVQTGNYVSNFATIPVSSSGRTCSDPSGLSSSDLNNIINKSTISFGTVSLSRTTVSSPGITVGGITVGGGTTTSDGASADFIKFTNLQLQASIGQFSQTSFGSCIVSSIVGTAANNPYATYTILDAGNISLTGSGSTKTLTKTQGFYYLDLGSTYLNAGTYSFAGAGGTDVGRFNVNLNVGTPVKWTNIDTLPTNIPRSQGVTVNWTGGDASSLVQITGGSSLLLSNNSALITSFVCTAPASAGTFTVPSYVLLALPAGGGTSIGGITIPNGSLSVGNQSNPVPFTASGLDLGYAMWDVTSTKTVSYQ